MSTMRSVLHWFGAPMHPYHAGRDLGLGFLFGACLMSVIIGVLALAGWYQVTGGANDSLVLVLLIQPLIVLLNALIQELLFRGIIFRAFEAVLGSWLALPIQALIFGLLHYFNPHATLASSLALAVETGIVFAAAYMLTRRIWLATGLHAAWNYFQGPIFGATVSGRTDITVFYLLRSTLPGPEFWTGGEFGPEAGGVALILGTLAGIVLLTLAVRRGQVVEPVWWRGRRRVPSWYPKTQP